MPEVKEEEQKIENLFEKIMKQNFPNLLNELDMQVKEAQRVPKKTIQRHIIIKMPTAKDKERILKAAREKRGRKMAAT